MARAKRTREIGHAVYFPRVPLCSQYGISYRVCMTTLMIGGNVAKEPIWFIRKLSRLRMALLIFKMTELS